MFNEGHECAACNSNNSQEAGGAYTARGGKTCEGDKLVTGAAAVVPPGAESEFRCRPNCQVDGSSFNCVTKEGVSRPAQTEVGNPIAPRISADELCKLCGAARGECRFKDCTQGCRSTSK